MGYFISTENTLKSIEVLNFSKNDIAYVAVVADKVIGWIHVFYTTRLECEPFCEIAGLVVADDCRGKGIGRALIEHIKPWCKEKKSHTLIVRSSTKRDKAHRFYEHIGFKDLKQQNIFEIAINH